MKPVCNIKALPNTMPNACDLLIDFLKKKITARTKALKNIEIITRLCKEYIPLVLKFIYRSKKQ